MDWSQIGKGVRQGCILSPHLFNLYAEYIMPDARLDEAQGGIKIAGRNINNLRYAGLKFNIQKTKITESGPISSWQIGRETMETVRNFLFLGSNIIVYGDGSHEIKRLLAPWKKSFDQLIQHIKKQRHYFADKSPCSLSYGISNSCVWM